MNQNEPKTWAVEWARDVQQHRTEQGMSISQLARECGMNKATVARYERAQMEPTLSRAMAISDALGMGIEW